MSEPLGYSREGDVVTLRMSVDDYRRILFFLGVGADRDASNRFRVFALANRLSAGNPEWTPYEIPPEVKP